MIDLLKKNSEVWNIFTREEEYSPFISDRYGRFPYYASKDRNIFEPKVSKYIIENGMHFEYPEDKKFAICLTHDIDWPYQPVLSKCSYFIKSINEMRFDKASRSLYRFGLGYDSWHNFDKIIHLEENYNAKSSFYFFSNYSYKIESLKEDIFKIYDRGWEVGLHGSSSSYANLEAIKKEKQRLESILDHNIFGYRNHFLNFKIPDTWEYLSKAGFHYDSTVGYADCVGFRNGMCHPYYPYNLKSNDFIDILELPLIIMDGALFDYMKLNHENALKLVKYLIDQAIKYEGIITILWHNHLMIDEYLGFYEKILQYCNEKNAWMTSAIDICNWWNKKNYNTSRRLQEHR